MKNIYLVALMLFACFAGTFSAICAQDQVTATIEEVPQSTVQAEITPDTDSDGSAESDIAIPTAENTEPETIVLPKSLTLILPGICALIVGVVFILLISRNKGKETAKGSEPSEIEEDEEDDQNEQTIVIKKEGVYHCGSCIGQGKRGRQEDALWVSGNPAKGDPV